MSSDPVPSLSLPAPAATASTVTPASAQSAQSSATEPQIPPTTPQKPLQQAQLQPQQQQHVTANHPASIAAAATVALSATLLDPNEWNALASTSMVTLDDLRSAFLEQRQQQLKDLERTHRESLREMLFMSETYDKVDVAGSPWRLGQSMEVAEDDARPEVTTFLEQYRLSLDNQKSIKDHVLDQPKAIRESLSRELKTGPIELAPPPTPTSTTAPSVGEAHRDRERQKELEQNNRVALHRSQAVARAAAAVQARAIAEGVTKIKPLTITAAESQGVRVAPLQPGQVPSFVIESTAPIASIPGVAITTDSTTPEMGLPSAPSGEVASTAIKVESPGKIASSPSKSANALEKAVSPVPGLVRNATAQSAGLRVPPSPMVVPTLPDTVVAPPLHPTLQVLAPNPLSVTYAASLRPLPPDPTRRITGAGIGGGAIHHRSGRKTSSLSNHANGNSYSSIAAAKIGPAGSGQADLYRWYVRARASPGAGMVGKADKCLMTSDWKVAFNEQRFVRAMARIEKLKAQGEWSFRQPKKQKGPVVRKAHWDHLLEEMKWLQTDFREERRWKMAVAFQLARGVVAWHRARTPAERAALCVPVQRPCRRWTESENAEHPAASQENIDEAMPPSSLLETGADEDMTEESASQQPTQAETSKRSDQEDITMDADEEADAAVTKAVDDALENANEAASARAEEIDADGEEDDADADADDVEAATAALVSGEPTKPPSVEVVREPLAQPATMPILTADSDPTASATADTGSVSKETQPAAEIQLVNALRAAPKDANSTLTAEIPPQLLATLRAPIFSTNVTTTVVSPSALLESLDPEAAAALLGIEVGDLSNAAELLEPGTLSFSKMFPELPLYGGVSVPDPSSKSDRRWDEGSLNQPPRLTHVTKLLDSRPLLVSTLEPSKNRANGRWLPDSDWVVAAEQSDPLRGVADGADSGMPPMPGSLLFARKSNRAAKDASNPTSTTPAEPPQPDARAALFAWTPDEDSYLMTLAKQYNNNWALVADLFNSTRLNTATDRREAWDCYDRCKRIQQAADEGKPPPGPPQLPPTAAEADKDKNGSTDTATSKRDKLSKKLGSKYDGSKRKLRRGNLMEVMRKSAKRREASKQAQQTQQTKKVNLNTHETHAQIKAGPAVTPQTLSALKAERDQAAIRQYYEQQRAQAAYQQQHRLLAQQAQAQRMAQTAGGANGQVVTSAAQAGKPALAAAAATGAGGPAPLSLPPGNTPGSQAAQLVQAQQKAAAGQVQAQQALPQPAPQAQAALPAAAQGAQAGQQQQQPTQQQVQVQLQSQLQASQMQNLYAQIQQQQRQQAANQQLAGQAAGMAQVRPAVGPLTQQQLATLTPQQQQQYHASLAAAAAQQQQLRNQMVAVAAAQQGAAGGGVQGLPFQLPNPQAQAQFQLMQQQQQQNAMQQNQPRPPNMQTQAQAQAQAAALQMYQQQQRQAAQVQAQAQMRPPQTAQGQAQQQQFGAVRPGTAGVQQRPPPVPATGAQNKGQQQARPPNAASNGNGAAAAGMPATIQALQQQLAISLATSNLSPEQINGLAIQLYKQAQQQQQAAQSGAQSPMAAGNQARPPGQANARPSQQILNQAIQALAAQNQKNQQQQQQQPSPQAGAAQARPPTPRPS